MATTGVKSGIVEPGNKLTGVGSEIAARSSQLKENIVSTLEEKMEAAEDATRRAIKRGRHAAEDLLDEATYEVKRRPVQAVGLTLGIGLTVGLALGWLLGHNRK